MLPYINVFGFEIQTYSVLAVVGFIVTAIMAVYLGKKRNISPDKCLTITLVAVLGVFLGGHILFALTNIKGIFALASKGELSLSSLAPYVSGMVFYGGLIGAIIAVLIYTKINKEISQADVFDVYAVSVPLFHAFGRVGCFFAGCCYGVESNFGISTYLNPSPTHFGVSRFPVQLVEAFFNLLIFFLLFHLYKRKKIYSKLIVLYLVLYALVRFVLEFFRGDDIRGFVLGVSTSQLISLIILAVVGIYIIIEIVRKRSEFK